MVLLSFSPCVVKLKATVVNYSIFRWDVGRYSLQCTIMSLSNCKDNKSAGSLSCFCIKSSNPVPNSVRSARKVLRTW